MDVEWKNNNTMNPRKLSSVKKERKILEIMEMICAENDLTLFTCAISPLNLQIMMREKSARICLTLNHSLWSTDYQFLFQVKNCVMQYAREKEI